MKNWQIEEPANVWEINLLQILSKILEKLISIQLTEYFEKIHLLQYSYRNNSSTEQALVYIIEQICKSMNEREVSLLVLLDLSNAFASVNHELLLTKVVLLNIDSTWFGSYLNERIHSEKCIKSFPNQISTHLEYPWDQYSVQSSLIFLSWHY